MCVCVSAMEGGGGGGLALNTSTHPKVSRMSHSDLYVRVTSRSSTRPLLNGGRGKKTGSQFGSVQADISDRKQEQGDREKNTGIHNGRGRGGGCLG